MDLLQSLMHTGLTQKEAQLYLLLSREGVMSGYEAAKQSGISRSNAYMALAGLVEKGGARRIDGKVQRYAAVSTAEFCRSKRRHFDAALECIESHMPMQQEIAEPFFTLQGTANILAKMKDLIGQAQKRIYASLSPGDVQTILTDLVQARQRGLKVVLITENQPQLSSFQVYPARKEPGQIRLIVDSQTVLTGKIQNEGESSCLLSDNPALVTLFKEAMVNEIKLIEQQL